MNRSRFAFLLLVVAIEFFVGSVLLAELLRCQTFPGKIGVNLGNLEFVDAMKSSGNWSPINGTAMPLDSNGWPMVDARIVVFDVRPFGTWAPPADDPQKVQEDVSGTYKLSFGGKATLSSWGDPFTILNQFYDAVKDRTTADLIFAPRGGLLLINFANTVGGVRDVRVIRPGYADTTTEIFRRELIDDLCPFSTMRFMDWEQTNNDVPATTATDQYQHWATRKRTTDATQNPWGVKKSGVAWEYIIALANQAKKDIWITIPVAAEDDYVLQLARLMKSSLDPSLKIYLEYSNEVWNNGFPQFAWNRSRALEEIAAGHSNLNYDGQTFDLYLASRRVARRIKEIGDIFRSVYGDAAFNVTLRPVFSSQVAWSELAKQGLSFMQHTYGSANKYFYALAGAPYFGGGDAANNATVPQLIHAMQANSDSSRAYRTAYSQLATQYGITFVAYEGGPDNGGGDTANVGNRILANRDTGIGRAVTHDLRDNWWPLGGDLFMYFVLNGGSSRYGCWGAMEDITRPNTPKYLALKSLNGGCGVANVPSELVPLRSTARIYPNPSRSGVVHVELPETSALISQTSITRYVVRDLLGRQVSVGSRSGRMFDIPVAELRSGVYTIAFTSGESLLLQRIVVDGR